MTAALATRPDWRELLEVWDALRLGHMFVSPDRELFWEYSDDSDDSDAEDDAKGGAEADAKGAKKGPFPPGTYKVSGYIRPYVHKGDSLEEDYQTFMKAVVAPISEVGSIIECSIRHDDHDRRRTTFVDSEFRGGRFTKCPKCHYCF